MIVTQLPTVWREMAETHRLFPKKFPEHMGTKIKDVEVPLRLILHHAGTGVSLKVSTAAAAAAGFIDISHVALHKWMVKIGPYLADLCGHMAYDNTVFSADRWAGYEVMTVDASALSCPGAMREWKVWVHPQNHKPIGGRLCAVLLPKDKAKEAQERVRREHGQSTTSAQLEAAKYVVVFTTVPASRLDTAKILELYRVRWQVELFIKRDKSIGGLDELPNFKPETIYSWICAKTLLLLISRRIVSSKVSIPPSAGRKRKPTSLCAHK